MDIWRTTTRTSYSLRVSILPLAASLLALALANIPHRYIGGAVYASVAIAIMAIFVGLRQFGKRDAKPNARLIAMLATFLGGFALMLALLRVGMVLLALTRLEAMI